ncbi:MAG: hypothetical protein AAF752_09100 [Bacteroidota bacterium]
MAERQVPFLPGRSYHVFNRGNNRDLIFYCRENYRFFLERYRKYMCRYVDTFAYALMPDHFHLFIRLKPAEAIIAAARKDYARLRTKPREALDPGEIVGKRLADFMTSYTKAVIKWTRRVGSLLQKRTHRKAVDTAQYREVLVVYIHLNPTRYPLWLPFEANPYTSYLDLATERPTWLARNEVLAWFGGVDAFTKRHRAALNAR